jgi:hypothetical protein
MKKIITSIALILFTGVCFSQAANKDSIAPKKELTKEEKAAQKAKYEADLTAAYKEAELTEEQIASVKSVIDEANKKSNELKNNAALSEEDKKMAKKVITDQKNAKMKEIMGEDKYRKYNEVRKKQKAANPAQ